MFGCICPNNHMKRRCDKIFNVVNHNPCVGKEFEPQKRFFVVVFLTSLISRFLFHFFLFFLISFHVFTMFWQFSRYLLPPFSLPVDSFFPLCWIKWWDMVKIIKIISGGRQLRRFLIQFLRILLNNFYYWR